MIKEDKTRKLIKSAQKVVEVSEKKSYSNNQSLYAGSWSIVFSKNLPITIRTQFANNQQHILIEYENCWQWDWNHSPYDQGLMG